MLVSYKQGMYFVFDNSSSVGLLAARGVPDSHTANRRVQRQAQAVIE